MSTFEEGLSLTYVSYGEGQYVYEVGRRGIVSINVTMEDGPICQMPWAKVTFENGRIVKLNLSLMEEVEIAVRAALGGVK